MSTSAPPRHRVAFVSGGTQGIGKEVARGLARTGISVIIGARHAAVGEDAARELGEAGDVRFHRFDLLDEASLRESVAFVESTFGKLDILVNNAATGGERRTAFEVSAAQLRQVYETNVFAVVSTIQAFFPLLSRASAPGGRIVNVSSERGSLTDRIAFVTPPSLAYSSSKTALNAITQHFAYQLEQMGSAVTINAAAPGHCATAFNNFTGRKSAAEGAQVIVKLALAGAGGPNGGFFKDDGATAPW